MEKDLKLVSGSDLRGVAVDLGSGVTLGPDQARSAAYAFAEFLKKRTGQSRRSWRSGATRASRARRCCMRRPRACAPRARARWTSACAQRPRCSRRCWPCPATARS